MLSAKPTKCVVHCEYTCGLCLWVSGYPFEMMRGAHDAIESLCALTRDERDLEFDPLDMVHALR